MLRLASSVNLLRHVFSRYAFSRAALIAGLFLSLLVTAHAEALSPETAPTGTYVYQVMRDGEVVGEQRADFERRGADLSVISDVRINVTLLGISVYDFTQRIEEKWAQGVLVELRSDADDDGNHRTVRLARSGERLVGSYDGKQRDLPGYLIPTTLWNSAAVGHSAVLDTVRGRERDTRVEDKGMEELTLPIGTVRARHYVFSGEFNREVWYSESGVLVAGQFEAKDGSIIRQELLRMP
ncbi:MAG TPA: DUF6134 family protein [Dongiaceae bacterium]|nr:DUF6134 family protein [Dongiaceae bacterium]